MKQFFKTFALALVSLIIFSGNVDMAKAQSELEKVIVIETTQGPVKIKTRPDLAPKHVRRILELTYDGFYDGAPFHRVIEGFMAQTGDPTGTGRGGSGKNIEAEFSKEPHKRGTVSMARASDPNSADSQFFIVYADAPHLNNQYTIWGEVISGMENVDKLKKGAPGSGSVSDPDKIITMKVEE
jgi:peptidylprolyl isomerase